MKLIIFLLSGMSLFSGFVILTSAKSAIHEIESFILFLIAAVLLIGGSIVQYLSQSIDKTSELIDVVGGLSKKYNDNYVKSNPLTAEEIYTNENDPAYCDYCKKTDVYFDAYNKRFCPNCQIYVK